MLISEIVRKWEFDIRSTCTIYSMSIIGFIDDSVSICSKSNGNCNKKNNKSKILIYEIYKYILYLYIFKFSIEEIVPIKINNTLKYLKHSVLKIDGICMLQKMLENIIYLSKIVWIWKDIYLKRYGQWITHECAPSKLTAAIDITRKQSCKSGNNLSCIFSYKHISE